MVIKKLPSGKWGLFTKDGKKLLQRHDSRKQAMKAEIAIILSKKRRGG